MMLSIHPHHDTNSNLDVIEVNVHQIRIIPLHSHQRILYISGVGLLIRDLLVLGALDHTWDEIHKHGTCKSYCRDNT